MEQRQEKLWRQAGVVVVVDGAAQWYAAEGAVAGQTGIMSEEEALKDLLQGEACLGDNFIFEQNTNFYNTFKIQYKIRFGLLCTFFKLPCLRSLKWSPQQTPVQACPFSSVSSPWLAPSPKPPSSSPSPV